MYPRKIFYRILSLVLLLSVILGIVPTTMVPAKAEETTISASDLADRDNSARGESSTQADLRSRAESLRQQINGLPAPKGTTKHGNTLLDLTGYSKDAPLAGLDRNYYLAAQADGQTYVFDSSGLSNGKVKAQPVTVEGNSLVGVKEAYTITYRYYRIDSNNRAYYQIGFRGDYFLTHADNSHDIVAESTKYYDLKMVCSGDGKTAFLRTQYMDSGDPTKYNTDVIGLSADKKNFEFHEYANTAFNQLYLYRFVWSVQPIYDALTSMKAYLETFLAQPNTYNEATFGDFLTTMEESISLYNRYYAEPSAEDLKYAENISETLRDQTNGLLGFRTLLDDTPDYIDIPVEILDFRTDGILMHPHGYHLVQNERNGPRKDDKGNQVFLPGRLLDPDMDPSIIRNARLGLTLPELDEQGYPIYHPDTVQFVAAGLYQGLHFGMTNQTKGHHNNVFIQIIDSKKIPVATYDAQGNKTYTEVDLTYGSFTDTISKTTTKANGGDLPWDQVRTCFDMAYYILHYFWRPVPEGEQYLFHDGYPYNITVPERNTLRLYQQEDGYYALNSGKPLAYSGSYIYNSSAASMPRQHPHFQPIDGLGFEKDNYNDTDVGSGYSFGYKGVYTWQNNFSLSMRAHGSFVYYEDQNLYFTFTGDDDVMFFINNRIAVDLGGNHAAVTDSLYLNDKKEELGLVDGQVYTFDMFYAERGAYAANLAFRTNIQIVSQDGKTSKVQYAHTEDGENLVSEATGLGKFIDNRQTVNVGEVVAYGFGILNDRQAPLTNVSFWDDSLGVNISPDNLALCDTENGFRKNNGLETTIDDIRVYYRSHTDGLVTTADPQELTYEALIAMLEGGDSVFAGSYFVRMENKGQLKTLLQRGIPVGCQMLVYGFLRRTGIEDLNYTNTVKSLCYYIPHGQNTTYPVIGEASCQLRVPENSSLPQVRKLEVVLDYGKAISVPLIEIPDLIHFEDGSFARVGKVECFLTESYNGELLKKLPDNRLSVQAGTQFKGVQGTFTVEEDVLTYQPTQFLDRVETLYAVVELHDFYSTENNAGAYPYVVAELRFIPATLMYYETDFAENIFTLKQVDSETDPDKKAKDWEIVKDGTNAADPNQDYERLNDTVYLTDIAREYIPAEAFFVDFDGEGFERRYRDNPQYSGVDFDKATAWYSHNTRNSIYNKHTLNAAAGTMELSNLKATDANGNNLGAWIQTIIPGKDIGSNALRLATGKGHYAQVRFRVENCKAYAGSGNISIFFSNSKDGETEGDVAKEERRARVALSNAEVLSGNYMTVRIPLDDTYYGESDSIDIMRLYIAGYTDDGTGKGKITVDYIYVGPEMGMEDDVYGNYLFVGFDDTPADHLRYSSSIYGAKTSGMTYRDLDKAGSWVSPSAKDSIRIESGCLVFEDKLDDRTITSGSKNYNCVHAGTFGTDVGVYNLPISYTPTMNDFCQIRLKIENADLVWDEKTNKYLIPSVAIEYKQGNISGRGDLDASYIDGRFHTITFPLDAPYWKKHWNESGDVLQWLHPVIYNLQGKNGSYTGAKFTIDYIFIGPEHLLERVSQHVDPVSQPLNHLFFDFNNDDAAKLRYSNPVYGETITNYDLPGNWSVDTKVGDTVIESFDSAGGTITFKDNNKDTGWNYIHSAKYYYDTPLAYTPGKNDYLRIRMKIDKGTTGTAPDEFMLVSLENFEGEDFFSYGSEDYPFAAYADGKYHIFTVPLDTEDYLREDVLTAVRLVISGTQNCTFTVDYIYVGPLTESIPSAPSLYFGFGNRGSGHWNTDSLRYDSDTYGFLNYDTNRWLSESEAVASSLTESVYGWGTAGNEDRGDPVKDEIKDYIPPFPPTEDVSYPKIAVTPRPDTGNLELVVDVEEGKTAEVIAIQTYPTITSPRYYWRHFMQLLNYHPAEENIVQIRFKTEGLTIGENFAVKLMYLPTGADSFITSDPLQLAPLKELTPEKDYVILTAQLDDTFDNAPAIERLRLVFEGVTAEKGDKILIDYVYAGVGRLAPEPVYGYDSSYDNDPMLSNGSSYVVEGQGVKLSDTTAKYTEASFSFRGTGFDIISRTGSIQATIRLEVMNNATKEVVKRLTVNNKGELELYQIPVVSVQGLEYGEYTVTFWVNAAVDSQYEFLSRGGQFHFDAVQIYDPMGKSGNTPEIPQNAYLTDLEAYPHIKEIRNILLSAPDFAALADDKTGAVFVDAQRTPEVQIPVTDASGETTGETTVVKPDGIVVTDHYTLSVETYNKIGPKNEVYLAPGQAVAFKLQISTTLVPDSVDVGVKTIEDGTRANFVAGIVTQGTTGPQLLGMDSIRKVTVSSATAQYYALPIDANDFFKEGDSRYCYIVLYNDGTVGSRTNVLSLTDVKVAYDTMPEIGLPQDAPLDPEIPDLPEEDNAGKRTPKAYFDFVTDGQTLEAAALVMKAVLETPVLAEGGKLMHSLNLASDISINYAVPKTELAEYDSYYLECAIPGQQSVLRIDPVEKDGYYYFTLEGLTAVQMTDEITATLYMKKDGRTYYWEEDRYSIAQYAYAQLNKEGAPTKLKSLCAELLRYGAAAQTFKGYGTDALADRAMTEDYRALLADLNTVTFGNTNVMLKDLEKPTITWAGKTLNLGTKVTLKFIFSIASYNGNLDDLNLRVSYTNIEDKTVTAIVEKVEEYNGALRQYSFSFDGLLAAELRSVVSVQIYEKDTPVSCTLQYSADTYGNNKTGALLDLCKALFAYSDSARVYFQ